MSSSCTATPRIRTLTIARLLGGRRFEVNEKLLDALRGLSGWPLHRQTSFPPPFFNRSAKTTAFT